MNDATSRPFVTTVAGEEIILLQDTNSYNHGLSVWIASQVLAGFFAHGKVWTRKKLRGKKVFETGAGCGLVGIVLAKLGADVLLTDLPSVTPTLRRNVSTNCAECKEASGGSATVADYSWGDDQSSLPKPFDLIVASDVVYSEALVLPLLSSVAAACSPTTVCYIANDMRCVDVHHKFVETAKSLFRVKQVPRSKLAPDCCPESVTVYELRLLKPAAAGDTTAGSAAGGTTADTADDAE